MTGEEGIDTIANIHRECNNTIGTLLTIKNANKIRQIVKDGKIMFSEDNGVTWAEDKMESSLYYDNTDKLPYTDISFVAVPTVADNNVVNVTISPAMRNFW